MQNPMDFVKKNMFFKIQSSERTEACIRNVSGTVPEETAQIIKALPPDCTVNLLFDR